MNIFLIALNHLLDKRGITQVQLAQMLDSHQSLVNSWLNGGRNPGVKTQTKIAAALGYELVDFLSLGRELAQGDVPEITIARDPYTPEWLKAFARRVDGLSKPQRLKLLSMIEGFLQAHDK